MEMYKGRYNIFIYSDFSFSIHRLSFFLFRYNLKPNDAILATDKHKDL